MIDHHTTEQALSVLLYMHHHSIHDTKDTNSIGLGTMLPTMQIVSSCLQWDYEDAPEFDYELAQRKLPAAAVAVAKELLVGITRYKAVLLSHLPT